MDEWNIFKNIFINISEIIDEIVIECHPEGMKFNALDRSHICFFECNISKKCFDEFEIDRLLNLYIDVIELVKILKRGKSKDSLIFKADNSTFDIIFKDKNTRTFNVTQIDMSDNSRSFPNMDFNIEFECDFDLISDSLKDAELYSDRLTFTCEDNNLTLSCDGGFGNYHNECLLDNSVESCQSTYGIDYLKKIFNNKLGSDDLKIKMGDNYPILVSMEVDYIKLNYLLAPRIENDE